MKTKLLFTLLLSGVVIASHDDAFGRGFGGGGGRGGGGGISRGGGGGGARPSVSRPSGGGARPGGGYAGGGSRPSIGGGGGAGRPNIGASRPNYGGGSGINRPNIGGGNRPNIGGGGSLAGGNRPNLGGGIGAGNRPNIGGGNRPELGGGNRPGIGAGNRPGNLPGLAGGNRPGIGEGNRPGIGGGNLPGLGGGNRPGIGEGNRPGIGNGNRPGIGEGNRPGIGEGNRPGIGNGTRPGAGGAGERNPIANLPGTRPGGGGAGERNPIANLPGNRPGAGGSGERDPIFNGPGGGGDRFPNRPGGGGDRFPNRPDGDRFPNRPGGGGDRFPNRPGWGNGNGIGNGIGNGNNININNNRWNNNWHHGSWNNGGWNNGWGGGAAWGLGFGMGYRRGFWNGYANSAWFRPWYGNAAAWGLGAWALGSVFYDSGYATYSNPYYVSNTSYYDYSQPIQVVAQPDPVDDGSGVLPQPPPQVQASLTHLDAARDAFMNGDYAKAGAETDLAIKEHPTDAATHEFRALVFFAVGDYSNAAATLYAVMSAGPGWDWTTMSSLYPNVDTYTVHLRKLEQYVKQNPGEAKGHFVLAYHYITATHNDAAIKQLQEVARLQPNDQLTVQLIRGLGGEVPNQPSSQQPTPMPPPGADPQVAGEEATPPPDIDPAKIVGRRIAKRPDGTTFTLDLTADKKFTWSFERAGKKQSFGGTYTVDGAVLVLEREDKATMPGMVTMDGTGFNYKLFGAPEDDPGLDFKKA